MSARTTAKAWFMAAALTSTGPLRGQEADLPAGIYGFAGVDRTAPDDSDLAPIGGIVGRARVVALGESIHTSGGYHDAKYRLVKYLVERRGFRVFAMETPRIQAQGAVDYLASCAGSPMDAARSVFGVFVSESTLDLFQWLCTFNAAHPRDRVRFVAFDMQEARAQRQAIESFLTDHAPLAAAELVSGLAGCNGVDGVVDGSVPTATSRDACKGAVAAIQSYITAHRRTLLRASSREALVKVQLALTGLIAHEDMMYYKGTSQWPESFNVRDREMAHAFATQRTAFFPAAKTIIWAHNYHIQRAAERDVVFGVSKKNMGQYLAEAWGRDDVAIGVTSHQADVNWPMSRQQPRCQSYVAVAASNNAESMLRALGRPFLIVDLASMTRRPQPFFDPEGTYEFSTGGGGSVAKLVEQFDGLIYLERSEAMDSPYWGDCAPGSDGFTPLEPQISITAQTLRFDFESCGDGALPIGWASLSPAYMVACQGDAPAAGAWSVKIAATSASEEFGGFMQCLAVAPGSGAVELAGRLRTEGAVSGYAGLWINVFDEAGGSLAFDNMQGRGASGSTSWTLYRTRLEVTGVASYACFGALLVGDGEAWVDDVEIRGVPGS